MIRTLGDSVKVQAISLSSLRSPFVGGAEEKVKEAMKKIEESSPTVLLVTDARGLITNADNGNQKRVYAALQNFCRSKGIHFAVCWL